MLQVDSGESAPPELHESYEGVLRSPFTIIQPLRGSSDAFSLLRALEEIEPRFVVMYDTDMTFVRQLEVCFVIFVLYIIFWLSLSFLYVPQISYNSQFFNIL